VNVFFGVPASLDWRRRSNRHAGRRIDTNDCTVRLRVDSIRDGFYLRNQRASCARDVTIWIVRDDVPRRVQIHAVLLRAEKRFFFRSG
jgi:hypothetical protein